MPLFSCLFTQEWEIDFYVAFEISVYFILMMGRAGLGPPNTTDSLICLFWSLISLLCLSTVYFYLS